MTSPRYQGGRSLVGILFVIILAGVFVLLALRLVPLYIDYRTITSIAASVQEDTDYRNAPEEDVRDGLRAQMRINNLRGYDDEEIYAISRDDDDALVIEIDYEERVPFMFNIDLIASFERRVGP